MDMSIFVSVVSLIISLASALIAYMSLLEQRRLTTNVTSYNHIASLEQLFHQHPEILRLHNVEVSAIQECGVSVVEFVYLSQSFSASDFYHRLAGDRVVVLTEYRKNLLKNQNVQKVWNRVIRDRFVSPGPFSSAVDEFIKQQRV